MNPSGTELSRFLFEVGMLNRTPRSGFSFLGSGEQSARPGVSAVVRRARVSEHIYRMLNIAFVLARLSEEPIQELHLLHLVMFHDLPETRIGDLNHVYQRYDRVNEDKLYADLEKELPFGEEIVAWVREFEARVTPEARLASDADQLELIAALKEQLDLGNARAADWIATARSRLKTSIARQLADELVTTPSDEWWFHDKHDPHWIDRGRSAVE